MADHFTLCPLCERMLNEPVQLNCFHIFCKNCIQTAYDQDGIGNLQCPVCKDSSTESLPGKDDFTASFIDVLSKQRQMTEECTMSNGNTACTRQATFLCLKCQQSLCATCKSLHCSKMAHDSSDILPYSEVLEVGFQRRKGSREVCVGHQGVLSQFCMQCNELVCVTGGILNHRGHWVLPITVALRHFASTINQSSREIDAYHIKHHQPYESAILYLQEEKERFTGEIKAVFQEVSQLVEDLEKTYIEDVEDIFSSYMEGLQKAKRSASALCLSAKQASTKLSLINKYGRETEILAFHVKLQNSEVCKTIRRNENISLPKIRLRNREKFLKNISDALRTLTLTTNMMKGDFTKTLLTQFSKLSMKR